MKDPGQYWCINWVTSDAAQAKVARDVKLGRITDREARLGAAARSDAASCGSDAWSTISRSTACRSGAVTLYVYEVDTDALIGGGVAYQDATLYTRPQGTRATFSWHLLWTRASSWGVANGMWFFSHDTSCPECVDFGIDHQVRHLVGTGDQFELAWEFETVLDALPQVNASASIRFEFHTGVKGNPIHFYTPEVRCDRRAFLRVGTNDRGCVVPTHRPTWEVPRSRWRTAANHIAAVQAKTGLGVPSVRALTRTRSKAIITKNRNKAKRKCRKQRNSGKRGSCDEYPFASTLEGCASAFKCRTRLIKKADNTGSGAALGGFYRANRVMGGDMFYVKVVP